MRGLVARLHRFGSPKLSAPVSPTVVPLSAPAPKHSQRRQIARTVTDGETARF
jgi:hypothetical protein